MIDKDDMYGRVFFADGYSFMLLGGQPGNLVVYFISVAAEGIGTPLVPISREWLQKEIDVAKGTHIYAPNPELLDEQLRAYYANVPPGGGAYFTCPLAKVIEYARAAAPNVPLAMIPQAKGP